MGWCTLVASVCLWCQDVTASSWAAYGPLKWHAHSATFRMVCFRFHVEDDLNLCKKSVSVRVSYKIIFTKITHQMHFSHVCRFWPVFKWHIEIHTCERWTSFVRGRSGSGYLVNTSEISPYSSSSFRRSLRSQVMKMSSLMDRLLHTSLLIFYCVIFVCVYGGGELNTLFH